MNPAVARAALAEIAAIDSSLAAARADLDAIRGLVDRSVDHLRAIDRGLARLNCGFDRVEGRISRVERRLGLSNA